MHRLLRGILAFAVLSAVAFASAHFVLDKPDLISGDGQDGTMALAPISLGNPAAAALLRTGLPHTNETIAGSDASRFSAYDQTLKVGRGDTLSKMLVQAGVSARQAQAAIDALSGLYSPRRIRAGNHITLTFQPSAENMTPGKFVGLTIPRDKIRTVNVTRDEDDRFTARETKKVLTRSLSAASGTIQSSLYGAGEKVNLPVPVLVDLIRAFSWDVDFQRDIRRGDAFEVMYEQFKDKQGQLVDNGNVLFASLTIRGERNAIYLHTTKDGEEGYFNAKGHGARKALLRTPIDGARLSSRFGKRRHPILGYTKRHTGVDFAAPRGTPIYAAGNGTLDFVGRKGGYGKYIRIRHNSDYKTAYAHMSRFAKGMHKGKRVRQGQIIGFVGTTGRSTGPHLHYEIMRSGRKMNPLRVKMPSGRRLKGTELARFEKTRKALEQNYAALPKERTVAQNDR